MSSRALRRLQREQEEARLAQQVQESEEEDEALAQQPLKKSAFDLLNAANDSDNYDQQDEPEEAEDEEPEREPVTQLTTSKKSKKRKKKKAKAKSAANTAEQSVEDSGLDEIDRALQSLKASDTSRGHASAERRPAEDLLRFYSLLAVNRSDLNALNEMKKLFGSAVLERDDDEDEQARRRPRGPQQLNMEQALSARYNRASRGQGLAGLALRQNVFMAGKSTWPRLPSGGLSMEVVEKLDDFTTEYRFLHKPEYQRAQKKFEEATHTLQADAIIDLAMKQPYHIATLLQMGEILKQQGDHSLAGDLYERALYNFGRSVQSTFGAALAEGKARMDFRRPENREFWLTAWRYISSLVQRGTFRTAYEWAKLLLSLDPEGVDGDPYRIRMIIDQLALRGGQYQHLIDLASTRMSMLDWGQDSPNIRVSLGLAHWRLKHTEEAEDTLAMAVKDFPWIFARLYQQLDLDKAPPSVWGQGPRSDYETLETESYAIRAKDIWNTPETLAFLRKVVEAAPKADPPRPEDRIIHLNDARHVIVSDLPQLISTLPREFTTMQTTSSDPLPPLDNVIDYNTNATDQELDEELSDLEQEVRREAEVNPRGGLTGWLNAAISRFMTRNPDQPAISAEELQSELEQARERHERPLAPSNGTPQNLGEELGMETVIVRTPEEYDQAMNRGQFPMVAEDASESFGELLRQQANQGADAGAVRAREDAARTAQAEEALRISDRTGTRQAIVEDVEDEEEGPGEGSAAPESANQSAAAETLLPEVYDEDANKRWLAGRGMLALKDFVTQRGADEKVWKKDSQDAINVPREYAERLRKLRQTGNRDWILNFALKQGAGKDASDMMQRLLTEGWTG